MRRRLHRRQPLHRSRIRQPERSHISIRPCLSRRPLDRVVAVLPLILVRHKLTVRCVSPAHVLNHHRVSVCHRLIKRHPLFRGELLPVRRPIHQARESSFRFRQPHVRSQNHAIAHRHSHIQQPRSRRLVCLLLRPARHPTSERPQRKHPQHHKHHPNKTVLFFHVAGILPEPDCNCFAWHRHPVCAAAAPLNIFLASIPESSTLVTPPGWEV